VVLKHKKRL